MMLESVWMGLRIEIDCYFLKRRIFVGIFLNSLLAASFAHLVDR